MIFRPLFGVNTFGLQFLNLDNLSIGIAITDIGHKISDQERYFKSLLFADFFRNTGAELKRKSKAAALRRSCCCLRTCETFERPELWEPVAIKWKKKKVAALILSPPPPDCFIVVCSSLRNYSKPRSFLLCGKLSNWGPHIDEASAGDARLLARAGASSLNSPILR